MEDVYYKSYEQIAMEEYDTMVKAYMPLVKQKNYEAYRQHQLMMNIVKLANGKFVANFSSPHPFTFEDGTVLPAKSNEEAQRLKVDFIEHKDPDAVEGYSVDMQLTFELGKDVWEEMQKWETLAADGHVDVVFCPLPMIKALRAMDYDVKASPFRCIRMTDRVKKTLSIVYQTY